MNNLYAELPTDMPEDLLTTPCRRADAHMERGLDHADADSSIMQAPPQSAP